MRRVISMVSVFLLFSVMFAYTGTGVSPSYIFDTLNPSLSLFIPQPGEIWYVGELRDITWNAFDTNIVADSILIHYSLDNGISYYPLAEPVPNTGCYSFQIPDLISNLAFIRITASDMFGNFSQAANPLAFADAIPLSAQNLRVWVSGQDAMIEWDPVTETVNNNPVTPDGYMLFEGNAPLQDLEEYELLAITPNTTYTYVNASGFYYRRFFYVVAYKGAIGRLAGLLDESNIQHRNKLTMSGVRKYLRTFNSRVEK